MKRRAKKLLGTMALIVALICLTCSAAFASTSVAIYDGSSWAKTYTSSQLSSNFTQLTETYSSYYCPKGGSYRYYDATGPSLEAVLCDALEVPDLDNYTTIQFIAVADGNYTSEHLNLNDVMNGNYYETPDAVPVSVPAIIALQFGVRGGDLGTTDCLRNFFGQGDDPGVDTMADWIKNLDEIHVYR